MQMKIKVSHILEAIEKLKDAGADIDECLLITNPRSDVQFVIMSKKDYENAKL